MEGLADISSDRLVANESLWDVQGNERVVFDVTAKLPWESKGETAGPDVRG